jgi:hypothetical protein
MEMTWLQQRGGRFRAAREVAEQLRSSLDCAEVRNALDAIPPVGGSSHQVDAVVRPYAEPLGFSARRRICSRNTRSVSGRIGIGPLVGRGSSSRLNEARQ